MKRNKNFSTLDSRYLFQEIAARKKEFLEKNPNADVISLGIGDTTEPLAQSIADGLRRCSEEMATLNGYRGYGPEQGYEELRRKISTMIYQSKVLPEEIFISDGAKCDLTRLQLLFGQDVRLGIQEPSYPAYYDSARIVRGNGTKVEFLSCTKENDFLFDLRAIDNADVLFLCSPNNPTGKALNYEQLEELVDIAIKKKKLIVFDTAYSFYMQKEFPKSIYEIENAKRVAIEVGSFSKIAGFSGVRLGWTCVPKDISYDDNTPLINDWNRLYGTCFNGASYLSQMGGLAVLTEKGLSEINVQIQKYLGNAKKLKNAFLQSGIKAYGAENAPYVWAHFPHKTSWQAFEEMLHNRHLITSPGIGFGPSGDGYLRISGFQSDKNIEKAVERITSVHTQ